MADTTAAAQHPDAGDWYAAALTNFNSIAGAFQSTRDEVWPFRGPVTDGGMGKFIRRGHMRTSEAVISLDQLRRAIADPKAVSAGGRLEVRDSRLRKAGGKWVK